jgi:hypothetical protein
MEPQIIRKCLALAYFAPRWMWGVATGPTRELYRVQRFGSYVRLEPTQDSSPLRGPNFAD